MEIMVAVNATGIVKQGLSAFGVLRPKTRENPKINSHTKCPPLSYPGTGDGDAYSDPLLLAMGYCWKH